MTSSKAMEAAAIRKINERRAFAGSRDTSVASPNTTSFNNRVRK